jgi:hypothetical protein
MSFCESNRNHVESIETLGFDFGDDSFVHGTFVGECLVGSAKPSTEYAHTTSVDTAYIDESKTKILALR